MRIRKRFPPHPPPLSPPLSSTSLPTSPSRAAPLFALSDPLLAAVQNEQPTKPGDDPPPRNQETVIGSANPRWGFLTSTGGEEDKIEDEGWKEEQEEENKKSNYDSSRKESNNIAAELIASMRYLSHASSSSTVVAGRWGEGDKTILPLKKRKGSFESVIVATSKEKMKSKTNKKCLLQNGYAEEADHDQEEKNSIKHANNGKNNNNNGGGGGGGGSGKKSKRGSVIMEGSRCSRVNGRGWRCCQPTLVGYSLCEHHLGKGRLRSMTSVRNKGRMAASRINDGDHQQKIGARDDYTGDHQIIAPLQENQEICKDIDYDDEDEEKKMEPLGKKKMKIGVVKARSMSSLLGQMDVDNREVATPNNIGGDKLTWL